MARGVIVCKTDVMPDKFLYSFVRMKSCANFFDMGSMDADSFVELVASDIELSGPIGNVRGHLRIDLFGIVRSFRGVILMKSMRFVGLWGVVVLGHLVPLFVLLQGG